MGYELDLVILVFSMVFFGCFSGFYAALEVLSCIHFDKIAEEKAKSARTVRRLLENSSDTSLSLGICKWLSVVLVALSSAHIASRSFTAGHFSKILWVLALAGLALLVPLLLFRLLAVKRAIRFVELSRFVVLPGIYFAKPIAVVLGSALKRISPRLPEELSFRLVPLKQKIEMFGYENGYLETGEQELMSSVFDFGDTKVREVMVPRIDIVAVNLSTSKPEALKTIVEAGHSRVPVYDETIDRIVGIVYTKDLLQKIVSEENFSLSQILREVFFVPESKKIDELLSEFKKRKKHMAIAVDEYGGTAGLITLEDVLEELVGDIKDEFDTEEELIKRLDSGSVLCSAKVHISDLNEEFGLDLPEGEVESLGGFLYEVIGRVPRVGDVVSHGNMKYEVCSVERQRIDKVLIKGLSSEEKGVEDGMS